MDPRGQEAAENARQRQLVQEFLVDTTRDVERMRGLIVQLEAGEKTAWAQVQNLAHNVAARALALKLVVLNSCARELEQLADEHLKGAPLDKVLMQCVGSAIETVALEIEQLRRA
jgi:hypothetical protein